MDPINGALQGSLKWLTLEGLGAAAGGSRTLASWALSDVPVRVPFRVLGLGVYI